MITRAQARNVRNAMYADDWPTRRDSCLALEEAISCQQEQIAHLEDRVRQQENEKTALRRKIRELRK